MKIWKYLFILVFVMDAWSQDSELSYQEMYTENGAQKLLLYGCKVYQDEETGTYQWFLESPFFLVETEGVRKLFDQEKETVTTIDQVFFQNCQIINVEDNPQIDSFSLGDISLHERRMEEDPEHDPPSGTYYHTTERTYLLQFEWGTLELGMFSDGSAWAEAISNQGERLVMNTYSAHKYPRTRNQSAVVQQTIIIRRVCNALRLACGALQICVNEWNAYREAVTYTDKFGSPEALRNLEDKFAEVLRTYRALERCARAKFHCTAALGACDVFGY